MTVDDWEITAEDLDSRTGTTYNQHVLCTASMVCYQKLIKYHNNCYM
jgi:hypothetical protein